MAYVAYDSNNIVQAVRRTEAELDAWITADGGTYSKSGDVTAPGGLDGPGQYKFDSSDGSFTPLDMTDVEKETEFVAALKVRLHEAYVTVSGEVRRQSWVSLGSGNNKDQAMVAFDRWVYMQIAVGRVIAEGGAPFASLTNEQKTTLVDHIVDIIVRLGYTWYKVMRDATGATNVRTQWAAGAIAARSALYSDIITSAGATRSPDGSWTALTGVVPDDFTPETATLTDS